MRLLNNRLVLTPTDLADSLACPHKTALELEVVAGKLKRPAYTDPLADVLRQRGIEHEARYVEALRSRGLAVTDLGGFKEGDKDLPHSQRVARSVEAMRAGADVIVQAPLGNDDWFGYADVLVKVPGDSLLGAWHYEAHDTKLARETRTGAILQLCVYTELLGELQGRVPTHFHVITPATGAGHPGAPDGAYRFDDVAAYYRLVKGRLLGIIGQGSLLATYPDPVEHCSVCRWWEVCNKRRRDDDHLHFVANLGRGHQVELEEQAITTLTQLAAWEVPASFKPKVGSRETYVALQDQAFLQLEQKRTGTPQVRTLPIAPHISPDGTPLPLRGLKRLPAPSAGDLYLDLEGDAFARNSLGGDAGEGSREYLFGLGALDDNGEFTFRTWWAFTDAEEQLAFEEVMDEIARVIALHPDAHVYHYAPYEASAFKRLAGRYATRGETLDELLRAGRLVDLYAVVRQSVRAGVESYSIKELEQYYGFARDIDLRVAKQERGAIEVALESGDLGAISQDIRDAVERYNRDDVRSTLELHRWLERLRADVVAAGEDVPRPGIPEGEPSEELSAREEEVRDLRRRLLEKASGAGTPFHLMAYLLDFHRREAKSEWWEFFRLKDLDDEALMEERKAISGLQFVKSLGPTISEKTGRPTRSVVNRFSFPIQDTDIKAGDSLKISDGADSIDWGDVVAVDRLARMLDVKVGPSRAGARPTAAFAHDVFRATSIENALFEIGAAMANGIVSPLAMALLEARPPVQAIQGPPGTGKTYRGGMMICDLVAQGKSVGVTAHSHAAISNLLRAVRKEAAKRGVVVPIRHVKREDEFGDEAPAVVGGTAWHWTRTDAEPVDVLFVDEAGQMSLANTLACTVATSELVLLGDPQQLEQPTKGVHPDGVGGSALQHFLAGHKVMPPDRGQFLDVTRRLAPPICDFTSECFYEGRLEPLPGLERQVLRGISRFSGAGLRVVPVSHDGNHNKSEEEVAEIVRITRELLAAGSEWVNEHGANCPLTPADILIVAPYNAHVARLQEGLARAAQEGQPLLREIAVGTVDKFQGQEAPVVIYSMATSRPEDAPRGFGFLYSLNRFNVATSRARCMCILVASPHLFEPVCQTPAQMQMANPLCRYRELSAGYATQTVASPV